MSFVVGQSVLWHSSKGYTPINGEVGVIDRIWPEKGYARLTLKLSAEDAAAAPPGFNGECSMCMPLSELSVACDTCDGSGLRTISGGGSGDPEWDADDQPCPECNANYSRVKP